MSRAFSVDAEHAMTTLAELVAQGRLVDAHRPIPRAIIDEATWRLSAEELRDGGLTLCGLWGDRAVVHMALLDTTAKDFAVVSLECPSHRFPSIGRLHPPAIRLERTIRDLWGIEPEDAPDTRPWLDHREPYRFLPVEGEHLHQIPVGPVHAGIIEPGHFRFTAGGEIIVRLEARLGYVHKGVEKLVEGAERPRAAK